MKKQDYCKSERCKERRKTYYELNKEVLKEKTRTWKQENKERVLVMRKAYNDTHRDERKERYQQHRDELLAQGKAWRKNNQDKIKEYRQAVTCTICASVYHKHQAQRHFKTHKHISALNLQSQNDAKEM